MERRKHPRVAVSVEVDFDSGHNFYRGETGDISLGGLFIETDVGLSIGSRISVRLTLLDRRISADAEVVWTLLDERGQPVGVGVKFLKLSPSARAAIEAFMAQRAPLELGVEEQRQGPPPPPDEKPRE